MGIRNFKVITIGESTGVMVANISGAGSVAIPTTQGGLAPKYLYVAVTGSGATSFVYICPTVGAVVGVLAESWPNFSAHADAQIFNVHGCTHIGYHRTGPNTSSLHLVPLEDF